MGKWRPIGTSPKSGRARLVWCPQNQNIYLVSWSEYDEEWVYFGGTGVLRDKPTLWQHLPADPTAEEVL